MYNVQVFVFQSDLFYLSSTLVHIPNGKVQCVDKVHTI